MLTMYLPFMQEFPYNLDDVFGDKPFAIERNTNHPVWIVAEDYRGPYTEKGESTIGPMFTTSFGLVLVLPKHHSVWKRTVVPMTVTNLPVVNRLTPEEMLTSITTQEVLPRVFSDRIVNTIRRYTAVEVETRAAAQREEEHQAKEREARMLKYVIGNDDLQERLASLPKEHPDKVLLDKVMHFDVTYSYSDDGKYWSRYSDYEKTLREELRASSLGEEVLDRRFAFTFKKL